MDWISTKELSERWQISPSRIVRLAKAGRLPRAQLVGKSWMFPPNIVKPEDMRRSESRTRKSEPPFRFPLYLYHKYTDAELADFTEDEKRLYRAEELYFHGETAEAYDLLIELLQSSQDRYVKCGALYYLSEAGVLLQRYRFAYGAYCELRVLQSEDREHGREIGFLIRDLEVIFEGNRYYLENFNIAMDAAYPHEMMEYLFVECAYSDMMKAMMPGDRISTVPYELFCKAVDGRLSPLAETVLFLYVGSLCAAQGKQDHACRYIRRSCRCAQENGLERAIAVVFKYTSDQFEKVLEESNPAQLARLRDLAQLSSVTFQGLLDYIGKHNIFHNIDLCDIQLINFARRNMTNKQIAARLALSVNTVAKRYAELLEKTDTHSKKELARMYSNTFLDY